MVKHLPPVVKQLLTLRKPQPRPAPPFSALDAVLRSTLQDAKAKKAENGWLTLVVSLSKHVQRFLSYMLTVARCYVLIRASQTCTLLTANAPPTVGRLYHFTTREDPDNVRTRSALPDALHKAALMRESALKSCIFVGVPRVSLRRSFG